MPLQTATGPQRVIQLSWHSTVPASRPCVSACVCVCQCLHRCMWSFSPLIITNRVSQALTGRVGHRAGIKQQNNGEFPPLNLLMGSQWLPWLRPNYQPLDSLTSLHQAGCVCGGSEGCGHGTLWRKHVCVRVCVTRCETQCQTTDRQMDRNSEEVQLFLMSAGFSVRWNVDRDGRAGNLTFSHSAVVIKLTSGW